MSDPTARRGDNITALLEEMMKSKRGWSKRQMKNFLFKKYRYGIREQTIEMIIDQLKEHALIFGKPIKPHSTTILYHPNIKEVSK